MAKILRRFLYYLVAIYRFVRQALGLVLHYPYILLSKSRLLNFLIPRSTRIGVITFDLPHGKQVRMTLGNRVVGHYKNETGKWLIQPPYRLFIDERKLFVTANL